MSPAPAAAADRRGRRGRRDAGRRGQATAAAGGRAMVSPAAGRGTGHLVRQRGQGLAAVGIRPGQIGTFRFGTVPELEPRIRDVVGLYLGPPDHAFVVSVAEEFQVRLPHRATSAAGGCPSGAPVITGAMARRPCLPRWSGRPGRLPRPAARAPGVPAVSPRAVEAHRGVELHVVVDGYRLARHPEMRRWLARPENRRVTVHVAPDGCPWLTLVEIFFGILAEQGIGRGATRPGAEVSAAISAFTPEYNNYNNRLQAFTWIKNATQLHSARFMVVIETVKQLMPQAADQRIDGLMSLTRGITLSVDTFERSMVLSGQARPKCALACPAPPKHQG